MSTSINDRRGGKLIAMAFAIAALGAVASPSAWAGSQPYLGWDFGGGLGIGVGTPPSAYDPCPTYGWPVYPYRCGNYYYPRHAGYYYPRRARHARYHHRYY